MSECIASVRDSLGCNASDVIILAVSCGYRVGVVQETRDWVVFDHIVTEDHYKQYVQKRVRSTIPDFLFIQFFNAVFVFLSFVNKLISYNGPRLV